MRNISQISIIVLLGTASFLFACNNQKNTANGNPETPSATQNATTAAPSAELNSEGDMITYGNHSYKVSGEFGKAGSIPTAFVTFTNFPADYREFEAVYNGLLGKSIQGAASMIPMAIEMYAMDANEGEKCFNLLCNSESTVSGIIRILKTKLVPGKYSPDNDSYIQRYMAAALLKGANSKNAYAPEYPYVVEMAASPNGVHEVTDGTVTYIYIIADGWDTRQRGVEVFKPEDGELYKVYDCPSCYTQCKNIKGTWGGLQ